MEGFQAKPAQLKRYIKQLNASFEQYLNYLGRLAFQEYEAGNLPNPPLEETCKALKQIAEQRARAEAELAAAEQARQAARYPRCPFCGQPVPPGSPTCPSCGRAAAPPPMGMPPYGAPAPAVPGPPPPVFTPAPAAAPTAAPMSAPQQPPPAAQPAPAAVTATSACSGCGAPLEPDAAFCTNCGKPTSGEAGGSPPEAPAAGSAAVSEEKTVPAAVMEPPAEAAPGPGTGLEAARCSFCGQPLEPDAAFCTNCGKPDAQNAGEGEAARSPGAGPEATGVDTPAAPEVGAGTQGELACPSCGAPAADPEALFCTNCGARLR